jgi:hypothetical protein
VTAPVFPTVGSAVPGAPITAALWNAQVAAGLVFLGKPPAVQLTQSTSQSLGNNSWTSLLFDTTVYDNTGAHSTTSNTSRITAQTPGWYLVTGGASYLGNATGVRGVRLAKNAAPVQGSGVFLVPATTVQVTIAMPPAIVFLNGTGDYIELQGYQTSGAALGTNVGPDLDTAMTAVWISN